VEEGEVGGGANGKTLGKFPGKGAGVGSNILDKGLLLGDVDPGDEEIHGIDGKALLADYFRMQAGSGGAGQDSAGEILEVDAAAVLACDEGDGLDQKMQNISEVLLAVTGDFGGQGIKPGCGGIDSDLQCSV